MENGSEWSIRPLDPSFVYDDILDFPFTGCCDFTLALKRKRSQTLWQGIGHQQQCGRTLTLPMMMWRQCLANNNMAIALKPLLPMITWRPSPSETMQRSFKVDFACIVCTFGSLEGSYGILIVEIAIFLQGGTVSQIPIRQGDKRNDF